VASSEQRTRARLNLLSSLKVRDSRVFWIGTTFASIAQAAFLVSSGWLAFQLGGSGAVGLVTFATMLPLLLATPVGGLLADRMDRRSLVIGAEIVQCIVALVLGVQTVLGPMPLAELVPLIFLSGIARSVELPTVQTMLPNLVPPDELLNTFAMNSLGTLGSRFAGPAVMAPVLATQGAGLAYLIIGALYLPALAFVLRVPRMPRVDLATVGVREQILEGGRYIRQRGIVALLLGVVVLHCSLTMCFDSTLPLFAKQNLRGDGAIYSSLVSAIGLGAIAASLLLAGVRSPSVRGSLLFIGAIASGAATALMATAGVWAFAMLAMFAVGASQALFMTLAITLVQEAVPDALRGRVTGLFIMSAGGIMSFGNLANGYLAGRFGASPVLGLPAVAFVILVLLISALRPTLRRLYEEGRLPADRLDSVPVGIGGG
jgi:MFS family permease